MKPPLKLSNAFLLLFVALASVMIFSGASTAAPRAKAAPAAAVQPASAAAALPAAEPVPAPHLEIRDALASLRRAKVHLEEAKHDFGGHRADAVRATDEAIRQLEICMKYE